MYSNNVEKLIIRDEQPDDIAVIGQITEQAFAGQVYSQQTEAKIIDCLRAQNQLSVSLVAELEDQVVGHIGFSKVSIDGVDLNWFGLGPLSVLPIHQGKGLGSMLVNSGLEAIVAIGARGCVLLGDPKFYSKFGFANCEQLRMIGPPPQYFQIKALNGDIPSGIVEFHTVFMEQ